MPSLGQRISKSLIIDCSIYILRYLPAGQKRFAAEDMGLISPARSVLTKSMSLKDLTVAATLVKMKLPAASGGEFTLRD
jgi:hypothetical protein